MHPPRHTPAQWQMSLHVDMGRIASAEELLPVMSALPPPCEPQKEAMQAARAQLAALAAPDAGKI